MAASAVPLCRSRPTFGICSLMSRLLRMWTGSALSRRHPRIVARVNGSSILSVGSGSRQLSAWARQSGRLLFSDSLYLVVDDPRFLVFDGAKPGGPIWFILRVVLDAQPIPPLSSARATTPSPDNPGKANFTPVSSREHGIV